MADRAPQGTQEARGSARADARSRTRFPIVADLEYSLLKAGRVTRKGHGKTVNLSSTGLLFESDKALPPDRRIKISVMWPVLLAPGVGLTLHITGRTVRAQNRCTAVRSEKYEFYVRAHGACGAAPGLAPDALRAQA